MTSSGNLPRYPSSIYVSNVALESLLAAFLLEFAHESSGGTMLSSRHLISIHNANIKNYSLPPDFVAGVHTPPDDVLAHTCLRRVA